MPRLLGPPTAPRSPWSTFSRSAAASGPAGRAGPCTRPHHGGFGAAEPILSSPTAPGALGIKYPAPSRPWLRSHGPVVAGRWSGSSGQGQGKEPESTPPARAKSEVLNSTPALAAAVRALSIRHMGLCNVTSACVPRCWSCGGQPARAKPKGRAREAFWLFSSGFLLVKFDLVCMDLKFPFKKTRKVQLYPLVRWLRGGFQFRFHHGEPPVVEAPAPSPRPSASIRT